MGRYEHSGNEKHKIEDSSFGVGTLNNEKTVLSIERKASLMDAMKQQWERSTDLDPAAKEFVPMSEATPLPAAIGGSSSGGEPVNEVPTGQRRVDIHNNESHIGQSDIQYTLDDKNFEYVRAICEMPSGLGPSGPDPYQLASHRSLNWPDRTDLPSNMSEIYNRVRESGIPNAL